MPTIYKYPFLVNDSVQITMPKDAKILGVGSQPNAGNVVWALVDPSKPAEMRSFVIYGTGHKIRSESETSRHVATWQDGSFVWHMFEV